MSEDGAKRVELKGSLEHTVSNIEIAQDGSLKVVYYDFSDAAESAVGGDVLYYLTVAPPDKTRLLDLLELDFNADFDADGLLLAEIKARFDDYFAIKEWLEYKGIPYTWESAPFP